MTLHSVIRDIGESASDASIMDMITPMFLIIAAIVSIFGIGNIIGCMMGSYTASMGKGVFLVLFGAVFAFAPTILGSLTGTMQELGGKEGQEVATDTTEEEQVKTGNIENDTGVGLENMAVILIGVLVVAVILVGGFASWHFIQKSRHLSRSQREEQAALAAQSESVEAEWNKYKDLHSALKNKVYNAETDWDTLFSYPAINDPSVRETRDMLFTMRATENVTDTPPVGLTMDTTIADLPYPKAVLEFQDAWNVAWDNAKKVKQSALNSDELKTIEKIMHMLSKAKDNASTQHEKQVAFERIDVLLQDLTTITVPNQAKALLAKEQQRAIEPAAPQQGFLKDEENVEVS